MPEPAEELPILYRDDRYIAVHKPAGLLVHRSPIDPRETRFAIQILRDQIGQRVFPAHRLDRPTSGVLLFALDSDALAAAMKLFEDRQVAKTYLAIVRGWAPARGSIDSPLAVFQDADGKRKSDATKTALTEFKTLGTSQLPYPTDRYSTSRYSLVELHPHTGRRHQLRRHLAHIRYPIVGDTRHGCNKINKLARVNFHIHRLLLAATDIAFPHPFEDETVNIHCPLEASFQSALSSIRLNHTQ